MNEFLLNILMARFPDIENTIILLVDKLRDMII